MTEKNSKDKWNKWVVYFKDFEHPDPDARLENNIRRNLKRWLPAGHEALDSTR